MKKILAIACVTVLTAMLFTACRGGNQPMETTRPAPDPTTQATTVPTTQATQPSTQATMPSETIDHGNGPIDSTNGADGTVGREEGSANTDSTVEGRKINPMTRNR